jgi:hypothetical protein
VTTDTSSRPNVKELPTQRSRDPRSTGKRRIPERRTT